jgi:PAS domain S-box-containing protein
MNQYRADSVRILAVDDEPHVLDLFEEFLSSETSTYSFEPTLCNKADEAVEAVRLSIEDETPFAVAFIDVHLALGPDGVWAAEQIRILDPDIEIVMVTAHGDVSPEEIVTRVPPVSKLLYIRKPFTPEEIKQFAVALSAKWQQEIQLHKIHLELESHVQARTLDLRKANEQLTREIEERKRAGAELRESEERYRTVLEANPDPVVVYDMEGKVNYFNPAFTRVFGWSLAERLGKKMDVFVPEENWQETNIMISRVLAGESFSGVETHRYTKDGNLIPVSISGAIYRDGSGNPVGSVINLRDIGQQKELEAQLQQAQKMEAVGTLAGGIAHDFNNLLQAIQGYTELLLIRQKKSKHGWRELQEVVRAAKRGGELTQKLLTFSRKVESKRQPLNLNQEVEELRELLERTIPKMIEVKLQLAANLQVINADAVQLKQVLMNLAVNAKDAMVDGGTLFIGTENVTLGQEFCRKYAEVKPGDYVQFTISDTGHGMDKDTLEHIFDPFYTTKEIGKGTGLGLAIVYGIVKNHEGYIMCHSQPRKGTTFKIYLPVLRQELGFTDMVSTTESELTIIGGDETILLVDDEKFIRELGLDVLGRAGYEVLTATDGESALELYRQERGQIDLVILDLIMPGMGGSKCLEELLKLDPHAQVLIASGYSPDGPTKGALEAGARGFVSKPYDTRQLLHLVRQILDRKDRIEPKLN